MLTYLHLENFRAFGEPTHIPLAPITLLFGENSAGKTSILHALALLKQSQEHATPGMSLVPRATRGHLDLGSFSDLVFGHDPKRRLQIGFGFESTSSGEFQGGTIRKPIWPSENVGVVWRFVAASRGLGCSLESMAIRIRGEVAGEVNYVASLAGDESDGTPELDHFHYARQLEAEPKTFPEEWLLTEFQTWRDCFGENAEQLKSYLKEHGDTPLLKRRVSALQEAAQFYSKPRSVSEVSDRVTSAWRNSKFHLHRGLIPDGHFQVEHIPESHFVSTMVPRMPWAIRLQESSRSMLAVARHLKDALSGAEALLAALQPIGPFRQPPSRLYVDGGTGQVSVGRDGQWAPDLLFRDSEIVKQVNVWLQRLDVGYKLRIRQIGKGVRSDIYEVRLRDQRQSGGVEVSFNDVGFGLSQLLPLIVQSVASKNATVTIEQPEVHIHPRLQAEVGDLLVACHNENNNQFVVETHSEHLILRLRRLVREGKLKPEDLCVLYVSRGKRGSVVDRIRIDERGDFLDEWPGGFFPERLNELL